MKVFILGCKIFDENLYNNLLFQIFKEFKFT